MVKCLFCFFHLLLVSYRLCSCLELVSIYFDCFLFWPLVSAIVGTVADVLLWRRWGTSVAVLVGSTTLWFLFERAGYNLLTFISNVILLLVVILFFWAKSASLLNR